MGAWETLTLKQAGVALIDCVHATPDPVSSGYPYIAIPQMKDGRIDFDDARKISPSDFANWTKKARPQKFDVVLSRRTNPGVTAPVQNHVDFALGQNLVLLRADGEHVLPEYLRWLASGPHWWGQIEKFMNVGAIFNSLRCADVPNFQLPIPPLPEQKAIAAVLSALDDKIELNRRMNETLEASARALFRDWFVDFGPVKAKAALRRAQNDQVQAALGGTAQNEQANARAYLAPEIWSLFPAQLDDEGKPEGWEWGTLLDQANWVNGAAYKNMDFVERPEGLPVIKIAELKAGVTGQTKFTNTDLGERYRITDGELLFSWSGNPDTSIDAFLWTGGPAWLNQHIFAVRENGKRSKAELFVLLKWLMPEFAEIARNKQTTGLGHVTKDDMNRMKLVRPSSAVQAAFADLITPIFDQILVNIQESRTLAQTRDRLLPKLMSGEIRVRAAETLLEAEL